MNKITVVPFLKWAGGKRWLTQSSARISPSKFNVYIEPFLGSGAVFFSVNPYRSILADLNEDLITTFQAIKSDPLMVEGLLRKHARAHSDEYYYKVRGTKPRTPHTKAARFIYLNRTCWNGLYRVNLKGEFNVPRGTKNSVILDSDRFPDIASRLRHAKILNQDFEETIDLARKGDFVYIDPPYTVKHNLNGFVKYNEKIFSFDDQIRLRDAVERAATRGAQITVSNANHESIRELYKGVCRIDTLGRESLLAASKEHRKTTSEVLLRIGW